MAKKELKISRVILNNSYRKGEYTRIYDPNKKKTYYYKINENNESQSHSTNIDYYDYKKKIKKPKLSKKEFIKERNKKKPKQDIKIISKQKEKLLSDYINDKGIIPLVLQFKKGVSNEKEIEQAYEYLLNNKLLTDDKEIKKEILKNKNMLNKRIRADVTLYANNENIGSFSLYSVPLNIGNDIQNYFVGKEVTPLFGEEHYQEYENMINDFIKLNKNKVREANIKDTGIVTEPTKITKTNIVFTFA